MADETSKIRIRSIDLIYCGVLAVATVGLGFGVVSLYPPSVEATCRPQSCRPATGMSCPHSGIVISKKCTDCSLIYSACCDNSFDRINCTNSGCICTCTGSTGDRHSDTLTCS